MTFTIALAGKGGTGKTTISALLIRALIQQFGGPLLAIDADPASNLHMALGVDMPLTVGQIREDMGRAAEARQLGVAISRQDYLEREVRLALEEGEAFDLLAMGRPEGQGCYCAVNHLLRQVVDELSRSYRQVVIDNEAGMEHISRRTTQDVDVLLLVSDPTIRGLRTAASMADLARELEINVKQTQLVINRIPEDLPAEFEDAIQGLDLEVAARIPADKQVNQLDARGLPLIGLDNDSPAWRAVKTLTETMLSVV